MGALYKEMGVNPLAGCLPLLVQMPFLIAIFYALQGYPYDQNYVNFLWLPSLGEPDPMYILPVLSALSTWIMSKQTSSGATGAAAQQQKIMTIFMPLFIGYISLTSHLVLLFTGLYPMCSNWCNNISFTKGLEANK